MNKIKDRTYLYKEILQKFSDEIQKVFILGNNKNINLDDEILVLYVASEITYNKEMHKNICTKDMLYITSFNFKDEIIQSNKQISILNIGNKYAVNISLKKTIDISKLRYITIYIAMIISDIVIVNKISSIDEGIFELDIALELGKDIYAIPGDIFDYKNYLANYAIKQGAIPICSKYDMQYILQEKKINVL